MTDKLNSKRVSLSLAFATGIISIICALLILIAPQTAIKIFGAIFHGIDVSQIIKPITLGGAVFGTVEVIVISLIMGWLFTYIYNKLA